MRRWSDEEIAQFQARTALLIRRGMSEDKAERFADRLALRDQDGDDRRSCYECSNLQRGLSCAKKNLSPILNMLHRCEAFAVQTK